MLTHLCPTPGFVINEGEGTYLKVPCRRRRCLWCGPNIWKPYVQAKLFRGIDHAIASERPIRVFCLTPPGHVEDFAQWNATAPARWSAFQTELRRAFPGLELEFWKVAEYQRRGLIHFHGLIVGIRWVDLDWLKDLAQRHGFGPRLEFHAPRGSRRALVGYFTKYLLKGVTDFAPDELANHMMHVTTSSHGWAPSWKKRRRLAQSPASPWRWVTFHEFRRLQASRYFTPLHSATDPGDTGAATTPTSYHARGLPPPAQ